MSPLRLRVEKGRLVLDEPTILQEGTVVDLVADDEGDDPTDEERRALSRRPDADPQIREIDNWWRANRPCSPDLFLEELAASFGSPARHRKSAGHTGSPLYPPRVASC
jgi:hypothetical protein